MAISRSGPLTKDTSTVALGLAKILVGEASSNVSEKTRVLNETEDSLGALNSSSFTSNVEYWRHESGFPKLEDLVVPLRENASLECEIEEISAENLAIARGIDTTGGSYSAHSGEIKLGNIEQPDYVRMEAIYTYPDKENEMVIIFPRAQVTSSMDLSLAAEDNATVPITFESKIATNDVWSGEVTAFDNKPLGVVLFQST